MSQFKPEVTAAVDAALIEGRSLKELLKFNLEFMGFMLITGREEEANFAYQKAQYLTTLLPDDVTEQV
jgi:hypothetical protein